MPKREKLSWLPKLAGRGGPIYLAFADALAEDLHSGRLAPGERLPPQRALAKALGVDLTTITRALSEARRRGLIDASVGRGTFARAPSPAAPRLPIDLTMNVPPQPEEAALRQHLQDGLDRLLARADFPSLLVYRDSAGAEEDRKAGAMWLRERLPDVTPGHVLVAGGAQAAILATVTMLARAGDVILAEALTYPGVRALAAHLDIRLQGLALDAEGIVPDGLEAACRNDRPKLLYCVPTLHNPTTATMSEARRREIAAIAQRHGLTIVEDDTYGFVARAAPPPIATFARANTIYIASLAKVLTPALRICYVVAPDTRWTMRLAAALRATALMPPTLMVALATGWIGDGTAKRIATAICKESAERQKLARAVLPTDAIKTQPDAHHLWLTLTPPWSRGQFADHTRRHGLTIVPSDTFTVGGVPPEAVRLGLGAAIDRDAVRQALAVLAEALAQRPEAVSPVV